MSHAQLSPRWPAYLAVALLVSGLGYASSTLSARQEDRNAALRSALLIHAGFDSGGQAYFAVGDPTIYSAPSYKELDKAVPGLSHSSATVVDGGVFGQALKFPKKNENAVFYKADKNIAYSSAGWTGTVSFWLQVDPVVDLATTGFTDPIQITDSAYNDGAIWVDFTQDNPRPFRLGVFGDLKVWNPENLPQGKNPVFDNRVVVVKPPTPFARGKWTHVVITHQGLGTPQGAVQLFVDGRLIGAKTGIAEPFTMDVANTTIRLGVNFIGMFDELAIFNRVLTEAEIQALGKLKNGVRDLVG